MSIGVILMIIVGVVVYLGAAQRVLDRLYLTDKQALLIIAAIIVGSFIEVPLSRSPQISVNVGGALIPVILAFYVLSRAGTSWELTRTIMATAVTGAAVYTVSYIFRDFGHGRDIIDPIYLYAVSGGLVAFIFGRSRRGAFIAGTLGFLLYDLLNVWRALSGRLTSTVRIGGAGALDSIVLAGIFAVLLAELIGETRERLSGGPAGGDNLPGKEEGRDEEE